MKRLALSTSLLALFASKHGNPTKAKGNTQQTFFESPILTASKPYQFCTVRFLAFPRPNIKMALLLARKPLSHGFR